MSWPLPPLSAVFSSSAYLFRFFQSVTSGCLSAQYFGTYQPMWPVTPRSPPRTMVFFSSTYSFSWSGWPQSSRIASTRPWLRASQAGTSSVCTRSTR
ncbi:hypothetical protein SMICM17S_09960 [Streptomyces microflavus]